MGCCFQSAGKKREAVLTFEREQLLYDIENYAFIEGSIMEARTEAHVRHTVQDVGQEGNVDRVTRVLDVSVAKCREILYPFTKHDIVWGDLDDRLTEPPVYVIAMSVPEHFSQTTLCFLEKEIHEYLVCRTLADWLGITHPEKAQAWALRAEDAEREIKGSLNRRTGRSRIRLHPF